MILVHEQLSKLPQSIGSFHETSLFISNTKKTCVKKKLINKNLEPNSIIICNNLQQILKKNLKCLLPVKWLKTPIPYCF